MKRTEDFDNMMKGTGVSVDQVKGRVEVPILSGVGSR
jgi:hypothetical protein